MNMSKTFSPSSLIQFAHICRRLFKMNHNGLQTNSSFSFSTSILDRVKYSVENKHMFKSSSLSFKSADHRMYTYFMHPKCELLPKLLVHEQSYEVCHGNSLVLTFYPQTTEDQSPTSSYQNRKTVFFTFQDVLKILKVKPQTSIKVQLMQESQYQSETDDTPKTYKKIIQIEDDSKKGEVVFRIEALVQNNGIQNSAWQLRHVFPYQDYDVFVAHLKKNLVYISGAMLMVELEKENQLFQIQPAQKIRKK